MAARPANGRARWVVVRMVKRRFRVNSPGLWLLNHLVAPLRRKSVREPARVTVNFALILALFVSMFALVLPASTALASSSASLDQCQNGAVGNPPTLNPCVVNTSFSDWVN